MIFLELTSNDLINGQELAQERLKTIIKQEVTIATLTEQLFSAGSKKNRSRSWSLTS